VSYNMKSENCGMSSWWPRAVAGHTYSIYLYARTYVSTRHLSTHVLKRVSLESLGVLTSPLMGLYGGIIPSYIAFILVVLWAGAAPSDPVLFIVHFLSADSDHGPPIKTPPQVREKYRF
jgi:hypothetical protein